MIGERVGGKVRSREDWRRRCWSGMYEIRKSQTGIVSAQGTFFITNILLARHQTTEKCMYSSQKVWKCNVSNRMKVNSVGRSVRILHLGSVKGGWVTSHLFSKNSQWCCCSCWRMSSFFCTFGWIHSSESHYMRSSNVCSVSVLWEANIFKESTFQDFRQTVMFQLFDDAFSS